MEFFEVEPSLENYWRAIILFGRNVASYKFALAQSLYEVGSNSNDLVTLEQLAEPFSRHICRHLQHSPKQVTSSSSKFLASCKSYNNQELSKTELVGITQKLGFNNVIDAFHVVNGDNIPKSFFIDERKTNGGIRITDNFHHLIESQHYESFASETEARWRLVEHAWNTGISRRLIEVEYDTNLQMLVTGQKERRTNITSCKDSLNGYQKGRCFYCYTPTILAKEGHALVDVDHFLPWSLRETVPIPNINGVWNLVLSCADCNRGSGGKFAKVPSLQLLNRLHRRNEYFINSHLPLRETLIRQTGKSEPERRAFLQKNYTLAKERLIHEWQPEPKGSPIF